MAKKRGFKRFLAKKQVYTAIFTNIGQREGKSVAFAWIALGTDFHAKSNTKSHICQLK